MEELGLICSQPGSHAYKQATVERIDIPNHLNRQFEVAASNQSSGQGIGEQADWLFHYGLRLVAKGATDGAKASAA